MNLNDKVILITGASTVLAAKLMRIVPEFLFEYISIKKSSNIKD